jgi:hypothetical protein
MDICKATLLAGVAAASLMLSPPSARFASISSAAAQERHADTTLEELLPSSLEGVALVRESQRGDELSQRNEAFDRMLKELGRAPADFVVASAYALSGLGAEVGAWRIEDIGAERLLPAFVTAVRESSATPLDVEEVLVGGRSVTRIGDAGQLARGPLYVLPSRDVLLFVQTPDAALAAKAVAGFR